MAAASPAMSNNGTETPNSSTAAAVINTPPSATNTAKNLRGLNKPKCIKCGNVARSRCPFQSCKSCCAKAQNPCHIHVLKGSSNIPDKIQSSGSTTFDQQSTDVSHPGSSHRVASLRQLSNSFAQFSNLQSPVRSRKPLTRKDAQVINEWRFLKLKESRDRNIEAENEAFDRYMRNVSLLEEVFGVNSQTVGQSEDVFSSMNSGCSVDDCNEMLVAGLKVKLRSNPARVENFRKRMQFIVDQGLQSLSKSDSDDNADVNDPEEMGRRPKKMKSSRAERLSALTDLIDKLNKARSEEDLKACYEIKAQLFDQPGHKAQVESDITDTKKEQDAKNDASPKSQPSSPIRKWITTTTIDQESLCRINDYFSSLEDIEDI